MGPQRLMWLVEIFEEVSGKLPMCGVGGLGEKPQTATQNTSLLASQAQAIWERGWEGTNSGTVPCFRQVSKWWDGGISSCLFLFAKKHLAWLLQHKPKGAKNTGQRKPKKLPPWGFVTGFVLFLC